MASSSEIWLSSDDLSRLEGVSRCAIIWRARNGYYVTARQVKSHGGGIRGMAWLVKLSDPKISKSSRQRFYLQRFIRDEISEIVNRENGVVISRLTELENTIIALREDLR